MDWARDHLGNDVAASKGGMSGFGLTCPTCGEPVRRRSGEERRPHFAHYSHRAKPDCENYFSSEGYEKGIGDGALLSRWKKESLNCGLFLAVSPGHTSPTLWLRIPPINLVKNVVGRLEIQSGLGHRIYQQTDLSTARLVRLKPQVPLANIAGFDGLQPLAKELTVQVAAFAADRNLFYVDVKGGRFIFSDEQLEWGMQYRLLSLDEISPPSELSSVLDWKSEEIFGGWHIYIFALPLVFKGSIPKKIEEFLRHRIRNPRPHLSVVDPMPHHIEIDGTYVYPVLPESILLRRSGSGVISATASIGKVEIIINEQGDEWIRLKSLWTDACEYSIAIDGHEQVIFRLEPCEMFCPPGVNVTSGYFSWNLCSETSLDASLLTESAVTIDCGSPRIAAYLARFNDGWILKDAHLSSLSGSAKELNGESFGKLRVVASDSTLVTGDSGGTMRATQSLTLVSVSSWLQQLVVRDYGYEGLFALGRYLSNPGPENSYRLGVIMPSRLLPYILETNNQQRNRTKGDQVL